MVFASITIMKKNPETIPLITSAISKSFLFISILTLSTTILQYANISAGCTPTGNPISFNRTTNVEQSWEEADQEAEDNDFEDKCEGRVYGMRPSNVISNLTIAGTVSVALVLPLLGAYVDHTDKRRGLSLLSFLIFISVNFLQGFTYLSTWWVACILQALVSAVSYMIYTTLTLSYATEIVEDISRDLPALVSSMRVWELFSMLIYLILNTSISILTSSSVKQTGRTGQFLATALAVIPGYITWRTLPARECASTPPPGFKHNISNYTKLAAFKVRKTYVTIKATNPYLYRFLVSMFFFESANSNVINFSITYFTQQLGIANVGVFFIIILMSTIPGGILSKNAITKWGSKKTLLMLLFCNGLTIVAIIMFAYSPSTRIRVVPFTIIFGFTLGAIYPVQRTLFFEMTPSGQEVEMGGVLQFCSTVFAWIPSLLFSAINEVANDLRFSMLVLVAFYFFGWIGVWGVDVEKGKVEAKKTDHLRVKSGLNVARVSPVTVGLDESEGGEVVEVGKVVEEEDLG